MYRLQVVLVFIISLRLVTVIADTVYKQDDGFPDRCRRLGTKINCTDLIPTVIPRNIKEVIIFNPTKGTLVPRAFCGVTWPDVKKLTVDSNTDDLKQEDLHLVDNLFKCLGRLETLKIQSDDQPVHFYRDSFAGLENVSVLDFTGCSRIRSEKIYIALSEKSLLPNLFRLILVDVANAWGTFKWTQNFTNVLGYRNITEINLSSTTCTFHVDDFTPLCDSLTKVNISKDIITDSHVNDDVPCNSLRTIDVSGTHFPKSRHLPKHIQIANVTIDLSRQYLRRLYDSVSTIYANSLIPPDHIISVINCTVVLPNQRVLTEVHLTKYNVPHFDLKVKANNLTYLDLSSNSMETIGRHVLTNVNRITKLDLANNTLSKCNSFNETFSVLFKSNTNLEALNFANNGLTHLPKGCFTGNKRLKYLDLSNNAFAKITFDILHLSHLTILDLRNNKIEYLDNTTMNTLDHLYEMEQFANHTKDENETLVVNLLGNPLKCNCIALGFIEWFVRTPLFAMTRNLYHCEIDGRQVAMTEAAIAEAKEDCEKPIRRRRIIILCSTIPTASVVTVIVLIILVLRRHRKRVAYQQFEDTVKLISDGDSGFQFPVFLSYSSEDQEFVLNHILEPLKVWFPYLATRFYQVYFCVVYTALHMIKRRERFKCIENSYRC